MERRNLVICRAGKASLHPRWLDDPATRGWDLLLSAYHDETPVTGQEILVHRAPGGKWQGLADLLDRHWDVIGSYERIWLPDDDLSAGQGTIDRMFAIAQQYGLTVFQPALSAGSYFSWVITLRHRGFRLRFTNFVETMAPGFTSTMLDCVRPYFGTTVLGWGLDFLWVRMAELGETAIIDLTPVRHTNPVGGSAQWSGYKSDRERDDAIGRWTARYIPDIDWRVAITYGGVTTDGTLLSISDDADANRNYASRLEESIGYFVPNGRPLQMLNRYIEVQREYGRRQHDPALLRGIATVLHERVAAANADRDRKASPSAAAG